MNTSHNNQHHYQLRFTNRVSQRRTQPIPEEKWLEVKEELFKLRVASNSSVQKIISEMEEKFGFKATKDQYNKKFKEWKWGRQGVPANSSRKRKPAVTVIHDRHVISVDSPPSHSQLGADGAQVHTPPSPPLTPSSVSSSTLSFPYSSTRPSSSSSSPSSTPNSSSSSSEGESSTSSSSSSGSSSSSTSTTSSTTTTTNRNGSRSRNINNSYCRSSTEKYAAAGQGYRDDGRVIVVKHISNRGGGRAGARVATSVGSTPSSDTRSPARSSACSDSDGDIFGSMSPMEVATPPSLISDTETTCSGWRGFDMDRTFSGSESEGCASYRYYDDDGDVDISGVDESSTDEDSSVSEDVVMGETDRFFQIKRLRDQLDTANKADQFMGHPEPRLPTPLMDSAEFNSAGELLDFNDCINEDTYLHQDLQMVL